MRRNPDVLVLGAGLVGLAVARALARRGVAVEVLEPRRAGAGSSSAGAGLLAPISDWDSVAGAIEVLRLARDGWRGWLDEVVAESGAEVEYDASGGFLVALDEDELGALQAERAIAAAAGEAIRDVAVESVRAVVPDLAPSALAALHLPGEHKVDNVAATAALATACRRAGVVVTEQLAVDRVEVEAGGVRVLGPAGERSAASLVVAAGAWSGSIAGLAPLPVRPVRGQMLRLEGVPWPWRGSVRGVHDYVVRRGASSLLVGATVEEAGFEERPTVAGLAGLLGFARRLFPGLAPAPVSAIWAGLRPGSPDGLPLIGPLDDERVVAACGHYRNGILLAPWTGDAVAGWLVDRAGIDPRFAPDRFGR
jgi:glycine oxidase